MALGFLMRAVLAFALTLVLLVPALVCAGSGFNWAVPLVVVVTALWCGHDSFERKMHTFHSPFGPNPVTTAITVAALWVFLFPYYLVIRQRLQAGELRPRLDPHAIPPGTRLPIPS